MSGVHGEQMPHGERFEMRGRMPRRLVREKVDDTVIESDSTLVDGDADGDRGEALAHRVDGVRGIPLVRGPCELGDDVSVARDGQRMHVRDRIESGHKAGDGGRRNALCLRSGAREELGHRHPVFESQSM